MTLDVKFEEQDQTFNTDFGEVQTVSDGGFERGYNEGYAQGEVEGYDKGKTDGQVDGYDKGKTDGLVEGYDKGKTDGRVEGEQVGFDNAVSKLTTLEVTENGEYTPSDDNIGFDKVTVNIGGEEKSLFAQYVEGTLTEITANDLKGVTTIKDYAFSNDTATSIEFPNTLTSIGANAFQYCKSLTSIKIPDSVTSIGRFAFQYCENLLEFDTGNGLVSLTYNMLAGSRKIEKLTLGENLERIMETAIQSNALTSLIIPPKVREIRSMIIGKASNKATLTMLPTTPPSLTSTNSIYISFIEKIIVPKGTLNAYKSATNWSTYADYIEEATE